MTLQIVLREADLTITEHAEIDMARLNCEKDRLKDFLSRIETDETTKYCQRTLVESLIYSLEFICSILDSMADVRNYSSLAAYTSSLLQHRFFRFAKLLAHAYERLKRVSKRSVSCSS
jgi:hypothetical protein